MLLLGAHYDNILCSITFCKQLCRWPCVRPTTGTLLMDWQLQLKGTVHTTVHIYYRHVICVIPTCVLTFSCVFHGRCE